MELIVTSKEDLEKMLKSILDQIEKSKLNNLDPEKGDRINQKSLALWLGTTQSTVIRWRKLGKLPYEKLPGSSKIFFYKSQVKAALQQNPELLQPPRK